MNNNSKARVQLDPGIAFKCDCGSHSLPEACIPRLKYSDFKCINCGSKLLLDQPVPDHKPGDWLADTLFCVTLSESGEHILTFDSRYAIEMNFPLPRLYLDETRRKAVVRALYRQGDLDNLDDEPILQRARELLQKGPLKIKDE